MQLPERTRTYTTNIFDSARWDAFTLRPGDIIVCTPVEERYDRSATVSSEPAARPPSSHVLSRGPTPRLTPLRL
jgi:hypothetical protein